MAKLSRFEGACLALVVAAFALRAWLVLHPIVLWDSAWYLLLARSFAEHGSFQLPWSEAPQYSGYWPPLYPVLLSPLVTLLGPSYRTLALGAALFSALLTLVVFFATRDLMGRPRAFAAAAVVAASPAFLAGDGRGMSESLLALLVALAAWTYLKSLQRPAWLLASASFAALAYLAKATLGVPLVAVAVLAAVAWRLRAKGLRGFLASRLEAGLAAVAILALAALALTRTGTLGGVGLGLIHPVREAALRPTFVPVALFKLAFGAAFLLAITLPFSLRVREAWNARRGEREGALWLLVALALGAMALFTASFYQTEGRSLVDFDNIRYLTPALVPFLWLVLPRWPLDEAEPRAADAQNARLRRRHVTLWAAAVATLAALLLLNPLSGAASLPRLLLFAALAVAPLTLAAFAWAARVRLVARRTTRGVEERWERDDAPRGKGEGWAVAVALVAGGVLAVVASAWFAAVGLALAVALSTPAPRSRALAMALLLLAASAPLVQTRPPLEEAAAEADARLPAGAILGVTGPGPYFSAVAPADVTLRRVDDVGAEAVDAILAHDGYARGEYAGFTRVASWDYAFAFSPPLAARLAMERALGTAPEVPQQTALALYVRNASG